MAIGSMCLPFEYGRIAAERIPGGLLYPFQGRCHLPNTTAAGEFCQVLRHFVRTGEVPTSLGAGKEPKPA